MKLTVLRDTLLLEDEVRYKIEDYLEVLEEAEKEIKNDLRVLVYNKKSEKESGQIVVNFNEPLIFKDLNTIYNFLDKTSTAKVLFYFPYGLETLKHVVLTVLLDETFISTNCSSDIKYYKASAYKEMKFKEYVDLFSKLDDSPSFDDWFDCNLDALFVESGTIIIESADV